MCSLLKACFCAAVETLSLFRPFLGGTLQPMQHLICS